MIIKSNKAKRKKIKNLVSCFFHASMIWFECKYCKRMNMLTSKEGNQALKKHRNQWIKVEMKK